MVLKVNGVELPEYPTEFEVTTLDVDDSETSVRTADATLNRDRIAVKRQIKVAYGLVEWSILSAILTMMKPVTFNFYYPDPEEGIHITKVFYVSNRPANVALPQADGKILWKGLSFTLTEV